MKGFHRRKAKAASQKPEPRKNGTIKQLASSKRPPVQFPGVIRPEILRIFTFATLVFLSKQHRLLSFSGAIYAFVDSIKIEDKGVHLP